MLEMNDRIRLARRQGQLTQSELAKLVGVQRSAVAQWEKVNGCRPTTENLIKIAMAGSMQFEWLSTGRGKMSIPSDHQYADELTALQLSEFALTDEEQRILRAFRRLDRRSITAILVLAESLAPAKGARSAVAIG